MDKVITIEDACKSCGSVIAATIPQDYIVGNMVKCQHCNSIHRIDSNFNFELADNYYCECTYMMNVK